jgi:hypothetical protein
MQIQDISEFMQQLKCTCMSCREYLHSQVKKVEIFAENANWSDWYSSVEMLQNMQEAVSRHTQRWNKMIVDKILCRCH